MKSKDEAKPGGKSGEKITVQETVEKGNVNEFKINFSFKQQNNYFYNQVKLSVLIDYFKSCSYRYSIVFITLYFLLNAVQAGNSFWLSIWSNRAAEEEQLMKNQTNFTSTRYIDLGIYTSLGVLQCEFFI